LIETSKRYGELGVKKPRLRRDESILEEAAAMRRHPLQRSADDFADGLRRSVAFITEDVPAYFRWLFSPTRQVREGSPALALAARLEKLSTRQKAVAVLAPWIVAAGLLFLLLRDNKTPITVPAAAEKMETAEVRHAAWPEGDNDTEPSAGKKADPIAAPETTTSAVAKAAPEPPQAPTLRFVTQVIRVRSALYASPNPRSTHSAPLKPGDELHLYPDYPAPKGWVLARRPGAEIGFVSELHLEGKKDPKIDGRDTKPAKPAATKSARGAYRDTLDVPDRLKNGAPIKKGPQTFTADDLLSKPRRRN
jgi:hypothetical protein